VSLKRMTGAIGVAVCLCAGIGTPVSAAAVSTGRDARACGAFSVLQGFFEYRYTYTVEVAQGTATCAEARTLMYRVEEGPPHAPTGWRCEVGQDRRSWAFSCTGHGSVVRAYGPTPHTGTWAQAAALLTLRLEVPKTTLGLELANVIAGKRCGNLPGRDWVSATYTRSDGAKLTVAEGRPYTCGQLGEDPIVAVWNVHGHAARLSEYCGPTGCARINGQWALLWSEHGIMITLTTDRLSQHELLAIARSFAYEG
jgi:hypothetical protein